MSERFSLDQIREFWTEQASTHGQAPDASWSDRPVIELEIGNIVDRVAAGDLVLDAGCANGFSTLAVAAQRNIKIKGVDNIPEMIEQAKGRLSQIKAKLQGEVSFAVGDITALDEPDEAYDKVIVTRVLINLNEWSLQMQALRECLRVLRPGGVLLLSEATTQGSDKLNAFRAEWGLGPIPMPAFNTYLDEERLIEASSEVAELIELSSFASTYYVATRVFKPLLNEALGGRVDVADPLMHWNRFFSQLPAAGDYGTQKLFVLRKR